MGRGALRSGCEDRTSGGFQPWKVSSISRRIVPTAAPTKSAPSAAASSGRAAWAKAPRSFATPATRRSSSRSACATGRGRAATTPRTDPREWSGAAGGKRRIVFGEKCFELLPRACGARCDRGIRAVVGEVVPLAQPAVDAAGNLCRRGTLHAARIPAEQHHDNDARAHLIRVGNEPAEARALARARACLTERLLAFGVVARARGAVEHGGQHAVAQLGQE